MMSLSGNVKLSACVKQVVLLLLIQPPLTGAILRDFRLLRTNLGSRICVFHHDKPSKNAG